jgi:glycosyltransferase involved in cell wall biosynthesis
VPDEPVSVAIPVLNGGPLLAEVLRAVRSQELDRPVQLLVADSGSSDGSRELAAANGAELIDVAPGEFSHGGTRNLLVRRAAGTHVAFLTQDSVPADPHWLRRLLEGFALAEDVALCFGPYRARAGSSPMVRRELAELFGSFAPDGEPKVDRAGAPHEGKGLGRAAFFSDANGCLKRSAWERVPFRDVPYAEDQLLARDMLAAGYAKTYHPGAAVVHSHDYKPSELLRRSFDEWRALQEVHGHVAPAGPRRTGLIVQRELRDDLQLLRAEGASRVDLARGALASAGHHALRTTGAALGSRASKLPAALRRRLSLEGRE